MAARSLNGFVNIAKPPGITSSGVVGAVKRTVYGNKIGHAGTLDPEAAGVLPVMLGKACRLFDVLLEKEKQYIIEIAFGASTDTQDAQGVVLEKSNMRPSPQALQAVLPQFIGDILQTPPAFSALKIEGKPAYAYAREGKTLALQTRPAYVQSIEVIEQVSEDSYLLRVVCGKGVYMRTICHDIGAALSCPAHMRFLLRTQSGFFTLDTALTLEEWQNAEDKRSLLIAMDQPLGHLPKVCISKKYEAQALNGLWMTQFESAEEAAFSGQSTRIYCEDRFLGLGRFIENAIRFQAMLWEGEEK